MEKLNRFTSILLGVTILGGSYLFWMFSSYRAAFFISSNPTISFILFTVLAIWFTYEHYIIAKGTTINANIEFEMKK